MRKIITRILVGLVLFLTSATALGFQINASRFQPNTAAQISAVTLDQFKGTEAGTLVVKEGPLIHFMSFGAQADLSTKNMVAFRTTLIGSPDQPLFDFILKYDSPKKAYLF